jgi:Tfp pilus assembly protein PilF
VLHWPLAGGGNADNMAESYFTQCLNKDPSLSAAVNNLGVIAFNRGHHEQAMRLFSTACKMNRTDEIFSRNASLCDSIVDLKATHQRNAEISTDLSLRS